MFLHSNFLYCCIRVSTLAEYTDTVQKSQLDTVFCRYFPYWTYMCKKIATIYVLKQTKLFFTEKPDLNRIENLWGIFASKL